MPASAIRPSGLGLPNDGDVRLPMGTQMIATIFDGITRHSPEGLNFKQRSEEVGWKRAVDERDEGTFDWTTNQPITENR